MLGRMIISDRASLSVLSTDTDPSDITQLLRVEPTRVRRAGETRRSGRVPEQHAWVVDVETLDVIEGDRTGMRALQLLLERCAPAAGRIGALPADCVARIWWSADSDSSQGGFVLPVELAVQIAALGVDLYGTVFVEPEAADEEE